MTNANKPQNPFEYSKDPELNMMFDKMVALRERVNAQFEKANNIAGLNGEAKFMQLEQVKVALPSFQSLREPNSSWRYGSYKTPLDKVKEQADAAVKAAREEVARVEALNAPAIENNNRLVTQIKDLMTRLGFTEMYSTYEFPTARSRNRKEVRHTAGYIHDIQRVRPHPNTEETKRIINEYESRIAMYINGEKEKEDKERSDADAKVFDQLINNNPQVVEFLMKSGINIMTMLAEAPAGRKRAVIKDALEEVMENALAKDKYLRLAYALECNRNDWNDGPNFAEGGLNSFEVVTKQDEEIYTEISGRIEDWDGDGRVFRDCKWNYSALYELVEDSELIKQVTTAAHYLAAF